MLSSLTVKRAFWLLDVALFLCIAFLGVHIFKAFTTPPPKLSSPDDSAVNLKAHATVQTVKPVDYTAMSKRTIFGEAGSVTGTTGASGRTGSLDSLPATTLKLRLLGTVVGAAGMSKALIEDETSKSQKLYKEGDKVAPMTAVEQIFVKKVILNREGIREVLLLGATAMASEAKLASGESEAGRLARVPGVIPGPSGIYTVDRNEWVDKGLEEVMGQSTPTAVWKEGQVEGWELRNIARNEYAQRLGLREGDVVMAVNGAKAQTLDEWRELARRFEKAPVIRVEVVRDGKSQVLTYRIR